MLYNMLHLKTDSRKYCFPVIVEQQSLIEGLGFLQQVDTTVLGLSPNEAKRKPFIASMGIYVFKKRVLLKLLRCVVMDQIITLSKRLQLNQIRVFKTVMILL